MDKTQFTENELQELEALEIRGGIAEPNASQDECGNYAKGCGSGASQRKCSNYVEGCGPTEFQICTGGRPIQ